jgi:Na+/H+-dicarboxylate symporter
VNRTVSSVAKLLFLAAAYGIDLSPGRMASFVALVVLLSFSTPGLPSSGRMSALPAYLAAGVPLEGYLLLETVEVIPDVFKTLANVTADMSVAVVVRRFAGPG